MDFRDALHRVVQDTIAENAVEGMALDQIAELARRCDHDDLAVVEDPELRAAYRMVLDAASEQVSDTLPTLDPITLPEPAVTPQEELARFAGQLDLTEDPTAAELNRLHASGGIHAILDAIDAQGGFTAGPHDLPTTEDSAGVEASGDAGAGEVEQSMRRTDQTLRACDAALRQLDQTGLDRAAEQEHADLWAHWAEQDRAAAQDAADEDTDHTSTGWDLA